MANINIYNLPKLAGLTKKRLEEIFKFVFGEIGLEKDINVIFVPAAEIADLNMRYRKVNQETDILTFDYGEESEIVICLDCVLAQKGDKEGDLEALEYTLIHGILHSFGYDHETEEDKKKMVTLETKIWREIK